MPLLISNQCTAAAAEASNNICFDSKAKAEATAKQKQKQKAANTSHFIGAPPLSHW